MTSLRVTLAVTNDLNGDQRLHRIASTLHSAGYDVRVIGRLKPDSQPLAKRPYYQHRLKLPATRGPWFYIFYNLALGRYLLRHPTELLTANDLDTLLGSYLTARWRKYTLLYDSHEYFTEVPELVNRPRVQKIWLALERWIFPRLQIVYTVNQSLAHIYQETYRRPVAVIRNVPFPRPGKPHARAPKVIIYQGALNVGRGIELMIDTMAHLPGYQLWIVGKGDLTESLRTHAERVPWHDRIVFHGFVPPETLAQLTPQAGLGLSLEEDLGGNYHYASPNKVYDYLQARVPILVSDLPEMRAVVEQYQVGRVLAPEQRHPEILARIIREMLEDESHYQAWGQAADLAARTLNWEAERERLLALYQQAAGEGTRNS